MKRGLPLLVLAGAVAIPWAASAQPTPAPTAQLTIGLPNLQGPEQVAPALKILLLLTVLSLAPAILVCMTSFTRIVVVLSFVRQAIGTQNVPPTQVMVSLALLLTAVVMAPVARRVHAEALEPYRQHQLNEEQAFEAAKQVVSEFLIRQTREEDLRLMYELSEADRPQTRAEIDLHLLVPAFLISELRTGFEMGFLLFLPFVLVDLIVASILTSLGMIMVPPTMLSMPMKVLLFVAVDGWSLLTRSVVVSFQ
jgi:flagellar biosynthetic protein FliP